MLVKTFENSIDQKMLYEAIIGDGDVKHLAAVQHFYCQKFDCKLHGTGKTNKALNTCIDKIKDAVVPDPNDREDDNSIENENIEKEISDLASCLEISKFQDKGHYSKKAFSLLSRLHKFSKGVNVFYWRKSKGLGGKGACLNDKMILRVVKAFKINRSKNLVRNEDQITDNELEIAIEKMVRVSKAACLHYIAIPSPDSKQYVTILMEAGLGKEFIEEQLIIYNKGKVTAKNLKKLHYYKTNVQKLTKKDKKRVETAEKYYKANKIEISKHIKDLIKGGQHFFCEKEFCSHSESQNWPDEGMHTAVLTRSELWSKWLQLCDPKIIKTAIYNYHTNRNESFHRMVMRLCPKEQNQNYYKVYGAAILAAARYNDGMTGVVECMSKININAEHLKHISQTLDKNNKKYNYNVIRSKSKKSTETGEREYVYGGDEVDW